MKVSPAIWLLVSIILYSLAGGCVFVFLLNRYLIEIKDRKRKFPIITSILLAMMLGPAFLGYSTAGSAWMLVPALILVAVLLGELRRVLIRRRCRGAPPVERENAGVSLSQPVTTTDLTVARYELACPTWRGRSLRIAHVSDLHVDHHLPASYYRAAMERVTEAQPDLVVLTGDFVSKRKHLPLLPDVVALARGRLGTVGILGNHDYWAGSAAVAEALRSAGITVLGNGCRWVHGEDGARVVVCGCEKPWTPGDCQKPPLNAGELVLVLTHTPDNIAWLSRSGVTAVFAGHYHAGQIRLPFLGALVVPSAYGRRFDHGHFVVNGTHLFVTAGIGAAVPPFRIYCQPDIFIVDIKGSA